MTTYLNKKILVVGKRGTGKTSVIIHEIYPQIKDQQDQQDQQDQIEPQGQVYVFTERDGGDSKSGCPGEFEAIAQPEQIHNDPSLFPKVLQSLDRTHTNVIVIDNCDAEDDIWTSNWLRDLKGSMTTVVMTAQSIQSVPYQMRNIMDIVIVAPDRILRNLKDIYQAYFNHLYDYATFKQLMSCYGFSDHQFLCLNRANMEVSWIKVDLSRE